MDSHENSHPTHINWNVICALNIAENKGAFDLAAMELNVIVNDIYGERWKRFLKNATSGM